MERKLKQHCLDRTKSGTKLFNNTLELIEIHSMIFFLKEENLRMRDKQRSQRNFNVVLLYR